MNSNKEISYRFSKAHIEVIDIFICQDALCFYCHQPMTYDKNSYATSYTRDHFYAKVKGNTLNGNTVLAHKKCNMDKKDRDPNKQEKAQFKMLYKKIKIRQAKIKKMKEKNLVRIKAKKIDNTFGRW